MVKKPLPTAINQKLAPVKPTVSRRRSLFFRFLLLGLVLAFLFLTALVKVFPTFSFDLTITRAVQSLHPTWFDPLMKAVSSLGDLGAQIALPILSIVGLYSIGRKNEALTLFLSTTGAIAISEFVKQTVARPRPDGTLIIQIGHFVKHDSFPSGHVLFFIGFFGYLLYFSYTRLKKTWLRLVLVTLFALLIILVGISRIYLGAHWFSDVLGSYLIGTAWLLLITQLRASGKLAPF